MGAVSGTSQRRVLALDGLRGFAALWVVAYHAYLCGSPSSRFGYAVEVFFDRGWIGVQIFFVLSGYLITGILLDSAGQQAALPRFLFRRALRIFPVYYLTLCVLLLLLPAVGLVPPALQASMNSAKSTQPYAWLGQWPMWCYFTNWVQPLGWPDHGLPHLWSLAVEEQFYLAWPLVCLTSSPRTVFRVCMLVIVACLAYRLVDARSLGELRMYFWTTCRADALCMGAGVAALQRMPERAALFRIIVARGMPLSAAILAALVLATKAMAPANPITEVWAPTFDSLAFAFLVASCLRDAPAQVGLRGLLASRPLRTVGTYSYGIYLFHKPIHDDLGLPLLRLLHLDLSHSTAESVVYLLALVFATFLLAAFSFHAFERPLLQLRERWDDH